MEAKLDAASELIQRLSREICKVENAARNTTNAAVNYVQCAFVKLRKYLDESEVQLIQSARRYFDEFLEVNDDRVEVQNVVRNLKALAEEGMSQFVVLIFNLVIHVHFNKLTAFVHCPYSY